MGRGVVLLAVLALFLAGCAKEEPVPEVSTTPPAAPSATPASAAKGNEISVNPNGNFNVPTRK